MLREVKNARFARRRTLLGRRHLLVVGRDAGPISWGPRAFRALQAEQELRPVALFQEEEARVYWLFEQRVYWEDEQLTADDVLALVRQRRRRAQRKLERAHAELAGEAIESSRRRPIPRPVRQAVFDRDGGRCVECGSSFEIQYDHIIPVAMGGAATVANLQILCAPCNRAKGAALG